MAIGGLCFNACDCCPTIGFADGVSDDIASCCIPMPTIDHIAGANLSRIAECRVVFSIYNDRNQAACGNNGSRFSSGDWPAVKAYIEGGGRFWFATEFFGCLGDGATCNAFLAALGSSMSWDGTLDPSGVSCSGGPCTPDGANIANGLATQYKIAVSSAVSGGDAGVFRSPVGNSVVRVEQLGAGFLFLSGDSSDLGGDGVAGLGHGSCYPPQCEFWRRLWDYADGDII